MLFSLGIGVNEVPMAPPRYRMSLKTGQPSENDRNGVTVR
jgi:hypothetical protein